MTNKHYWGSGGGATGALMGGDTWVLVRGMGRGYWGTSGRRHMGTLGEWGVATGALMRGNTCVLAGGMGAGLQGH